MQQRPGSTSGIDPGGQETAYIASAIAPQTMQVITAITNIIVIILGWLSIVVEVFIRYDFGERYLSWLRLFFAYALIGWFWFLPSILFPGIVVQRPLLFVLFVLAFIGLSIMHRIHIWRRYQSRIPWHSMSFGTSRLTGLNLPVIGGDDWTLYRWYEPFLCFVVGLIVRGLDRDTGVLICAASVALLIKNHMVYFQMRSRILDLIDARIEGMYFNEQAFGKNKSETAGISVVQAVWPVMEDAGIPDIKATVGNTMTKKESTAPTPSVAIPIDEAGSTAILVDEPLDFSKTVTDMLGNADKDAPSPDRSGNDENT